MFPSSKAPGGVLEGGLAANMIYLLGDYLRTDGRLLQIISVSKAYVKNEKLTCAAYSSYFELTGMTIA